MHTVASKPIFTAGGVTATYADAVLLGLHSGEWTNMERGIAGSAPLDGDVGQALIAFRRERRLLAAEDLRAWLDARGLSREDLIGRLRRWPEEAGSPRFPEVLRAEAFVSGTLERLAHALAQRAIAHLASAVDAPPAGALVRQALDGPDRGLRGLPDIAERASRVLAMDAALAALRARVATEETLRRRLAQRRLDMTRVRFEEVVLPSEGAAREAVLCVSHDGMALPQVAARAGVRCPTRETEIGALDGPLRSMIGGRRPGDLVGPLPARDGWRVAVVRDRHSPSLADRAVRERLAAEVADRRIARMAAGRLEWHGPV